MSKQTEIVRSLSGSIRKNNSNTIRLEQAPKLMQKDDRAEMLLPWMMIE